MHYLGSKARHAKEIIAITTANRRPGQIYVEPFVGGGNVINKVPQGAGRIANDKNEAMVALLDCVGNHGWLPPETMTKSAWEKIMRQERAKLDWQGMALFAFAATGPTFGSMWCGQWAKDDADKPAGTRYRQARDAAANDAAGLRGIEFRSSSFDALIIPDESLVYCDPPYAGTTDYAGSAVTIKEGESNSKNVWKAAPFWRWADDLVVKHGCTVFVSEYRGPENSTFPFAPTAEWLAEDAAYRALPRLDPVDLSIPSSAFSERHELRRAIDAKKIDAGRAYAAKWQVVWSKEVISDFSASRGKGDREEDTGKIELEKLFTRAP